MGGIEADAVVVSECVRSRNQPCPAPEAQRGRLVNPKSPLR